MYLNAHIGIPFVQTTKQMFGTAFMVISGLVRYALIKKNDIFWEFFPTWGGGSSQIPKLL